MNGCNNCRWHLIDSKQCGFCKDGSEWECNDAEWLRIYRDDLMRMMIKGETNDD